MAAIVVPTTAIPAWFQQTTDLGGTMYLLTFTHNGREDAWYLSIATQGGTAIVEGRKLRVSWDTLRQFAYEELLPAGLLMAPDLDGSLVEPGRDDLSERIQLMFEAE